MTVKGKTGKLYRIHIVMSCKSSINVKISYENCTQCPRSQHAHSNDVTDKDT